MTAVDEGTLRGLLDDMGGDVEVLRELIQSYLEEAPKLLGAARAAVLAGDLAEAERAVHTLKSTSATFGAHALSERSRESEVAARAGTLPSLERVDELARLFEAVRKELLARLG